MRWLSKLSLPSKMAGYFSKFSFRSWSKPFWFSLCLASALSEYLTSKTKRIPKQICKIRQVQANLAWDSFWWLDILNGTIEVLVSSTKLFNASVRHTMAAAATDRVCMALHQLEVTRDTRSCKDKFSRRVRRQVSFENMIYYLFLVCNTTLFSRDMFIILPNKV